MGAERRPECWHIAWAAYREAEWLYKDVPIPESASEWTDLRRWAKGFIARNGNKPCGEDEEYKILSTLTDSRYGKVCRYLDEHREAQVEWPVVECQTPDTADLQAAAMRVLLTQPNRVMIQVGYIGNTS